MLPLFESHVVKSWHFVFWIIKLINNCRLTLNWSQLQGVSRLRFALFEVTSSAQIQRTVWSITSPPWITLVISCSYQSSVVVISGFCQSSVVLTASLTHSPASRFTTSPLPAIDFASRGDKRRLLRRQIPLTPRIAEVDIFFPVN